MDKCNYCSFNFTNKEDLKQHLNSEHSDISYKERHKYFQSLFTFNKGAKAHKKLNKTKGSNNLKVHQKYRFKFDKKYLGKLLLERCKCDNCNIIYDQIWFFKNTNIGKEVRICKKCELGINKHNRTKGFIKIIYTSFESKR